MFCHLLLSVFSTKHIVPRPEQVSRGLHPEQAQHRFNHWLDGMREEVESLVRRARESTEEDAEDRTKPEGSEDVGGVLEEVAKLRRLVGDVQSQLGQQHQEVQRWLGTVGKPFAHGIDADDGVMGRLDFVVAMLMAVRSEGFDTPRMACVLPPWEFAEAHGLSEEEQKPEAWVKRLKEWREDDFKEGKGFLKKKKLIFLVCAHTHRLVPCGLNGQGYDIQQPRKWFRMTVSLAKFALQVACSTLAAMAAVSAAGAGAVAEATVSAAMGRFESMVEAQLEGLTLDDDCVDVGVERQVGQKSALACQPTHLFVSHWSIHDR